MTVVDRVIVCRALGLITVELIEAMISIPITVRGDAVRVLEKEEDRESDGADEEERPRGAR